MPFGFGRRHEDTGDKMRVAEKLQEELHLEQYELGDVSDTEVPHEVLAVIRYIDMVKQSVEMTEGEKLEILEKIRIASRGSYKDIPAMISDLRTKDQRLNFPHNSKVLLTTNPHRAEPLGSLQELWTQANLPVAPTVGNCMGTSTCRPRSFWISTGSNLSMRRRWKPI